MSTIDLFATILVYTGHTGHASQGRSLRGLIEGIEVDGLDYCVSERTRQLMVRTKRWKLLYPSRLSSGARPALYDLENDPHELTNLIGYTPSHDPMWDGIDIWPLLTRETEAIDRTLFWNFRGRSFGGRIGDWKLSTDEEFRPEKTELFDIGSDPYERREVSEQYPEKVAELVAFIRAEREKDGVSKRGDVP